MTGISTLWYDEKREKCEFDKQKKGWILMKMQAKNLWKVPVYCAVSSWISFYATVYLGRFFFVVQEMGAEG